MATFLCYILFCFYFFDIPRKLLNVSIHNVEDAELKGKRKGRERRCRCKCDVVLKDSWFLTHFCIQNLGTKSLKCVDRFLELVQTNSHAGWILKEDAIQFLFISINFVCQSWSFFVLFNVDEICQWGLAF